MGKSNILVICAHSDDQIFGPGGTLAKYAKEGMNIKTVIFSYGEGSHPHFKKKIITHTRAKEAEKADEILGGKGVIFLGLPDDKRFKAEYEEKNISEKLKGILMEYAPEKIFTHSENDQHSHHRIVNEVVLKAVDELKLKTEVYTFEVWNFFSLKNKQAPKMVVDITDTFKIKIKALKVFKSQLSPLSYTFLNNFLYLGVFIKAWINGLKYKNGFAEVFYKAL